MVSDYKITMEQAEYEMVCYRRVFNFVRLLDQEKLEKLNAEGLLAAEGGQTKKADLCIGHFCQGCVAMEAFLRKAELCKLEFIGDDIYQIMAKYLEIDGNPYVMELLKKMDKNSLIDRKDHERLRPKSCIHAKVDNLIRRKNFVDHLAVTVKSNAAAANKYDSLSRSFL